ncbi:MAG: N-acetylmuramoyl-L-alanine amidase [Actinomycetota bacterium]|nr:N-acetylmuramoyl-L-alanine amidase [Actinomycetota bacterium]
MRILLGVFSAIAAVLLAGCTAAPRPAGSGSVSVPTVASSPVASTTAPSSKPAVSKRPSSTPTSSKPVVLSPSAKPLTGTVIVLNPGHNGANAANSAAINRQVPAGFGEYKACDTTGTETNAGYQEHAFNWDVSLRVRTLLQAHGVTVIMTRSSDSGVGPCVDERARIGNQAGVAAVVSIHADGAPTSGHGFHVCEDSRQPGGAAVAAASHRLTVAMHDALLHGSGMTVSSYLGSNGYYPRDDLAGLNLATVPATFLEIGNMRNSGDASIQTSPAGRQRIAQAVADGILAWLGR